MQPGRIELQRVREVLARPDQGLVGAADRARQAGAHVAAGVDRRRLVGGIAALVQAIEVPAQVLRQPRVERERQRIAAQAAVVVGLALFMRGIEPVAEAPVAEAVA